MDRVDYAWRAIAQALFVALDVLVNNVGVYKARPFLDCGAKHFERLPDVNLFGTIHVTQASRSASRRASRAR